MSYEFSQLPPHVGTRSVSASNPHPDQPSLHLNWGTVFGLALTLTIGAAFWTGVGVLAARLLK